MNRGYALPVFAVLAVGLAAHVTHIPVWVTAWCVLAWAYVLLARARSWPLPGKALRTGLALAGTVLAVFSQGLALGLDTGVSVLAVTLALKPMEMDTRRDAMSAAILAAFLMIFGLFYSQSLSMGIYVLLAVLVLAGSLVMINRPGQRPGSALGAAGIILVQALPLALILFLFFPRMPSGVLGIRTGTAAMGFSQTLAMGEVARLAANREVAFRVSFQGAAPKPENLYWRGAVLWNFDGKQWSPAERVPPRAGNLQCADPVDYQVVMEPHGLRWLFALDTPIRSTSQAFLLLDMSVQAHARVRDTMGYSMRSCVGLGDPGGYDPKWFGLRLPPTSSPKARELARVWAEQAEQVEQAGQADDAALDIVRRGLAYFRDNPFFYTLEPPPLGADPVDGFLFETRQGFCEHFAGSFAFLMRAAGVPARVISGYQGGEINPVDGHVVVRQLHAHAWVEVWSSNRGWVRVDPTAAVSPERILLGPEAALAQGGQAKVPGAWGRFTAWLGQIWDSIDFRWTNWVLSYNFDLQRKLMAWLGFERAGLRGFFITLLVGVGLFALAAAALYLLLYRPGRGSRRVVDPAHGLYLRFCRKLDKAGLSRPPQMGPRDFSLLACQELPGRCADIQGIVDVYVRLRYQRTGPEQDRQDLARLKGLVRAFKV